MQKENIDCRPRQDSNLQSPDPKSGALSIRPRGLKMVRFDTWNTHWKEFHSWLKFFWLWKKCQCYDCDKVLLKLISGIDLHPMVVNSRVAQWKRAGPITQRSVDRNYALLTIFLKSWNFAYFMSTVRMAEWSKAPDSRCDLASYIGSNHGNSGPRMRAWVQIPLLTDIL